MADNPFGLGGKTYTAEQAQAALANAQANPVLTKFTGYMSGFGSWRVDVIPGYTIGNVRIEDQSAEPTNPGIREVSASTYGKVIPLSLGQRRLAGNILQSSNLEPRLIGTYTYDVVYEIPLYEEPGITGFRLVGGLYAETSRSVHEVRVTNPEDSSQYVDVEVIDDITLVDTVTREQRIYKLDN